MDTYRTRLRKERKKRGLLDLIADILIEAEGKATKTQLVYKCNMNFNMVNSYLEMLQQSGLLAYDQQLRLFHPTNKGNEYVERYLELLFLTAPSRSPPKSTSEKRIRALL